MLSSLLLHEMRSSCGSFTLPPRARSFLASNNFTLASAFALTGSNVALTLQAEDRGAKQEGRTGSFEIVFGIAEVRRWRKMKMKMDALPATPQIPREKTNSRSDMVDNLHALRSDKQA